MMSLGKAPRIIEEGRFGIKPGAKFADCPFHALTPVNKGERMSCWENTGREEDSVPIMGTTLSVVKP
jgi:hypothetical protein